MAKKTEVVRLLLAVGANPNLKTTDGATALTYANRLYLKEIAAMLQKAR
jgi:ankyrin repeat protein